MTSHGSRREPSELPRLALAVATLSAVGFSLTLFIQLLWLQQADRTGYELSNVLGVSGRSRLLFSLAMGIALPAVVALLLRLRKGREVSEQLSRLATLLGPVGLLFILPGFFLSQLAESKPLFYLVTLTAFSLAARALLTRSFAELARRGTPRWLRWLELRPQRLTTLITFVVICGAAAGTVAVLGRNAIAHHHLLQTVDTDVGVADNMMANLSLGRWFRAPALFGTQPGNYLTVHPDYSALLFLPFYRWHPGPEGLLWLQAGLATLSVVPLFFLARRMLGQRTAVWACLAFLSLAPLHGALLYNFSWLPLACLLSFTLYYAIVAEQRLLLWLSLPLLLATTDAAPLCVFGAGLAVAAVEKRTRLGVLLCLVATLVFALNTAVAVRGAGNHVTPQFARALTTLCTNPVYFALDLARAVKVTSVLHALTPLGLLPVASVSVLPLALPGLLFTSANTEFWPAAHAAYPYTLVWIPGGILAVLFTLRRLRQQPGQRPAYLATVITLSLTLLSHSYNFGALLRADGFGGASASAQFLPTPVALQRYADLKSVTTHIPPTASVVATMFMVSQISTRADAFDASRPYGTPDYVFFSSLELVGQPRESLSDTLSSHGYALVSNVGEFYLFRRGPETPDTTTTLRRLGLLREPSPPPTPATTNPTAPAAQPAPPAAAHPAHRDHHKQ